MKGEPVGELKPEPCEGVRPDDPPPKRERPLEDVGPNDVESGGAEGSTTLTMKAGGGRRRAGSRRRAYSARVDS